MPKYMFAITDRGVQFMESAVKQKKPFYLQLSHYATHGKYQSRPETLAKVEKDSVFKGLDRKEVGDSALTAAMCSDLDETIGTVLKKIDQLGIADNTYVIFVSDNGYHAWNEGWDPLRGQKWWLWEGAASVCR